MARGLALPVGRDKSGRAKISTGADQTYKIARIGLQTGESTNPFQDLGLDRGIIYSAPEVAKSRFRSMAVALFKDLEQQRRAKFNEVSFRQIPDTGEIQADISYKDLETDPPEDQTMTLSLGTTAR